MNAVVDEDLPRSLNLILTKIGFKVFDLRDQGLRGSPDDKVFLYAQKQKAVLFSGDLGFSNIQKYPLGKHYGICIPRFPNIMTVDTINKIVEKFLLKLESKDYAGNLIIVSPSRIRIRRNKKSEPV